jgi:hypothetical protein
MRADGASFQALTSASAGSSNPVAGICQNAEFVLPWQREWGRQRCGREGNPDVGRVYRGVVLLDRKIALHAHLAGCRKPAEAAEPPPQPSLAAATSEKIALRISNPKLCEYWFLGGPPTTADESLQYQQVDADGSCGALSRWCQGVAMAPIGDRNPCSETVCNHAMGL